jgi:hypothetical protein
MSLRSLWLAPALLLMAPVALTQHTVRAQKQNHVAVGPPSLALSIEPNVIKACEDPHAQLTANARSSDGSPLHYRWTVNGGKLKGEGANPNWDLTGLQPGVYKANVEVDDGRDLTCTAFSSTSIVVLDCPPPPPQPVCPTINISCPESVKEGQSAVFSTTITAGTPAPGTTPTYEWTVTAGKIISGQGTPSITVDTTGLSGQTIRANVNLTGYGVPCPATCSVAIPIMNQPRKFDEYYDIARNDEKARLDNFAIQLQQEPGSQGYVIIYPGRKAGPSQAQARSQHIIDYLVTTRGVDAHRVVVTFGPAKESWATELWVVPAGASPPVPQR